MASHYVKLMRTVQPNGPYLIGGWCYGGLVAVEMAHQLLTAGQELGPLLLIETPAQSPPLSMANYRYYLRRLACMTKMTPAQLTVYFRQKIKYYRGVKTEDERRYRRVSEEEGLTPEQAAERNSMLERLEEVYRKNINALYTYQPRFFPGEIILFNAAEQDPAQIRDPMYGWPSLAKKVTAHVVPGNHDTILMEPHVHVLARKLSECLSDAFRKM